MRNLITNVLILISLLSFVRAQSFRLQSGLSLSKVRFNIIDQEMGGKVEINKYVYHIPGFYCGIASEFKLKSDFSMETGLNLISKGFKHEYDLKEFGFYSLVKTRLYYLEAPIMLNYRYKVGDVNLIPSIGMGINLGIKGNSKSEVDDFGVKESNSSEISFGSKDEDIRRYDLTFNSGLGIEYNRVQVKFQYQLGLFNMINNSDEGKLSNRSMTIGLSYRLSSK